MILGSFIIFITVLGMEALAWATHKYIMHGPLWFIHQSHHTKAHQKIELNDVFALFWAALAIFMIVLLGQNQYCFYIGLGVCVYGLLYFFFHDILVHKRLKLNFYPKNSYLKRIVKAHHIHHKTNNKQGAEAFGFIYAAKKYSSKI
jgi:beta-carotene 3-hydroxylase